MVPTHEKQSGEETIGSVSSYSDIGERNRQEDRMVAETISLPNGPIQLLAVMDGHGGSGVAQLAADRLVSVVHEECQQEEDIDQLLARTVASLSDMTEDSSSGSTISIAAIPQDKSKVFVAVLGDSPVFVFGGTDDIKTSPEHNVRSNLEERERALSRGAAYDKRGYIGAEGSNRLLQMSRALGDRDLNSVLERTPDIYSVDLGEDSVVVVASDGILDSSGIKNQGALHYLANLVVHDRADAETVVREVNKQGKDNTTAIVWRAKEN